MCRFREWNDGRPSYSTNIPGYAQGAYFPGDEPGLYCRKTEDRCAYHDPARCPLMQDGPLSVEFDFYTWPGEAVLVKVGGTTYQVMLDGERQPDPEMSVTFGLLQKEALLDEDAGKVIALVNAFRDVARM